MKLTSRPYVIRTVAHIRIPSSLDECHKEAYLRALTHYVSTFDDTTLFIVTGHRWISDIRELRPKSEARLISLQETDKGFIHRVYNITIVTCHKRRRKIPAVKQITEEGYYTVVVNFGESLPATNGDYRIDCVIAATASDIKLPEDVDRNILVCSRHYPEGVRHGCMNLGTGVSYWRIAMRMSDSDIHLPEVEERSVASEEGVDAIELGV